MRGGILLVDPSALRDAHVVSNLQAVDDLRDVVVAGAHAGHCTCSGTIIARNPSSAYSLSFILLLHVRTNVANFDQRRSSLSLKLVRALSLIIRRAGHPHSPAHIHDRRGSAGVSRQRNC